jgi:stearoyl-CoA desaturase (Delta-9 desaturase)
MYSGLIDLQWWGYVLVALALTHVTIASVTIFLHRHQAHRALDLHPIASHFFRLWLWLTTGMVTKEWAAVHRKHHAKCETAEDPHSPQIYGINRVLFGGVFLYVRETANQETMERYGYGTPDDWMERNVYSRFSGRGILITLAIDLLLFGLVPGVLIWGVQMIWIPFWAAGVINGVGHFWGYRNFQSADSSTNIFPIAILIGGEELHNNHHAYATSAKLSSKWYEFDIGWLYIRVLSALGLAKVKKTAPKVRYDTAKTQCDLETLQAVITHRYEVMARYAKTLSDTCRDELHRLADKTSLPPMTDATALIKRWLHLDESALGAGERATLNTMLKSSNVLATIDSMRSELVALWSRSNASREQLVRQLQDWCDRADRSEIAALRAFARRLRCYA